MFLRTLLLIFCCKINHRSHSISKQNIVITSGFRSDIEPKSFFLNQVFAREIETKQQRARFLYRMGLTQRNICRFLIDLLYLRSQKKNKS
jgi:hypothetical protein